MNFTDRIRPTDKGITTYLDELENLDFQIPTFQRDVVWEKENVKKLWDSIYKFYPLGSILVWKTNVKLQNHRKIGGHKISEGTFDRSEYQYILDGQQRTTSLLTSLYGGNIEGQDGFDPSVYIDLTIEDETDIDDDSYKKRFLYWDEINNKGGSFKRNTGRQNKFNSGLIVKLLNIKNDFGSVERSLVESEYDDYKDYDHPIREQLRRLKQVLDNYRLSFIELKGIQVSEVCQIFERINQAGKPLDIFDIVVAKTFKPESEDNQGFYLREYIDSFRKINNSNFLQISDFDYLQIIAILIRENIEKSGIWNITPRYLNDIKTEHIEEIWEPAKKAINKTFDFFENTLNLKGPQLIPYRYFYLTIAAYFFRNDAPDYNFIKMYFWFHSFHNDDLLSNTGDVNSHIEFLISQKNTGEYSFPRFLIDKETLRTLSYSSKGRLSRAVLSLYASEQPKDWKYTDRNVIVDNLFFSTDKPNLHHIFPTNYILQNPGSNELNNNSLMNIAYLTQITNLEISDKNPLIYIRDFNTNPEFEPVIKTHLLPNDLLEWSRLESMPADALDQFIEKRVDLVIEKLKNTLSGINFEVIDTKQNS
ncbi:DUF262 domain-containing protein [Photobacterium sagamiensis]|uniref:GmrSD restriction endonuclease domain-containing protein n=1 Tax=Photobacterium sagamiensis TaxID=2910241 RepID=UPI003D0EDF31